MADSISLTNSYFAYITNSPYVYPSDQASAIEVTPSTGNLHAFNTGWHILPNMLWKHFCTPKQWAEININYEAYRVDGFSMTLFNMVPLTTQLAIGGESVFTAFNNCIYAIGYQDKLYETQWHNWYYTSDRNNEFNLLYKEGLMMATEGNTSRRMVFPRYLWQLTNPRTLNVWTWNMNPFDSNDAKHPEEGESIDGVFPGIGYYPNGLVWDPLNRPDEIKELRPGKNAIQYKWERHPCDENKWYNFDAIAAWFPYTASGPYHINHERPGEFKLSGMMDPNELSSQNNLIPPINDYTIPNWADLPIVTMQWWWHEMKSSISPIGNTSAGDIRLKYLNFFFNGTEAECYKYGPTQCFVKMIPIINDQNVNIECSAQVAVKTSLHLSVKKRRSAIYCPTWGPFPWRSVYSARSKDRNFFGSFVRYRTGGMRRTWQNAADSGHIQSHARRTPYINNSVAPSGTGQGSTFTTPPKYTMTTARGKAETSVSPSAPPLPMDTDPGSLYPPLDQFRRRKH
uniref:Capsid protein n=1 Tax=Parvoviridae sp. TaxID=1940570 RepID=A0A7D3QLK5_9VIRU|nr:MAG: hypothetical protein [Parvoviridae sp.]